MKGTVNILTIKILMCKCHISLSTLFEYQYSFIITANIIFLLPPEYGIVVAMETAFAHFILSKIIVPAADRKI